jgi:hypothetical protein
VHEEHQVGEKVAAVFLGNYISIYNGKNTPQYETLQKKKKNARDKKKKLRLISVNEIAITPEARVRNQMPISAGPSLREEISRRSDRKRAKYADAGDGSPEE